jgi:hypothetical protein
MFNNYLQILYIFVGHIYIISFLYSDYLFIIVKYKSTILIRYIRWRVI